MRAVVCPDKFKGTLTSMEAAAAVAAGLRSAGWEAVEVPGADGGEGTAAVLRAARGGHWVAAGASDALGRRIEGRFALLADGTAVVDAAEAIGMWRLRPEELDPLAATSRGAGELIAAALETAETVIVAAGGTATVDGGAGLLEVLDARAAGRVRVACDVRTRWEDAARVFGPQKGADEASVGVLSARLAQLAAELPEDPTGVPLTGCGGGLSGALWSALAAELVPGAVLVLDELGLDRRLAGADLVITGEGRLDAQTAEGKLVAEVARRARAARVRCIALVGRDDLSEAEAAALGLEQVIEAEDADALARQTAWVMRTTFSS
jgi:glycerate 2-kinase